MFEQEFFKSSKNLSFSSKELSTSCSAFITAFNS